MWGPSEAYDKAREKREKVASEKTGHTFHAIPLLNTPFSGSLSPLKTKVHVTPTLQLSGQLADCMGFGVNRCGFKSWLYHLISCMIVDKLVNSECLNPINKAGTISAYLKGLF